MKLPLQNAGIDIASVPADVLFHPEYRQFAPTIFSMAGQTHTECGSPSEYLKWCNSAIEKGADALYCSGSFETVSMLSNEYIPVVGHVGLVPAGPLGLADLKLSVRLQMMPRLTSAS